MFEHPRYADSWKENRVQSTLRYIGGIRINADMCQFNMRHIDKGGKALIKKPTKFMTNTVLMAEALNKQYVGDHVDIPLQGGV